MARTAQHKSSPPEYNPKHAEQEPARMARIFTRRGRTLIGSLVAVAIIGTAVPAVAASSATGGVPLTQTMQTAADLKTASSITLAPVDSTWTSTREPGRTHDTLPYISVTKSADQSFLKFDLSAIAGRTVASASLELRGALSTAKKPGVQVYGASSNWKGSTLTEINRPAFTSELLGSSAVTSAAGKSLTVDLPVTSVKPGAQNSFELRYAQASISSTYYRTGPSAPKLHLTFSDATSTPEPTPSPTPSTTPTTPPTTPPVAQPPVTSSDLAFPISAAGTSSKKVFAHYFPPYPISMDNQPAASDYYTRNYLTPGGEGGAFAASGGLLRDRPAGRAQLSGDWKLADMSTEVNNAAGAGIDGFTVDILSLSGLNWDRTVTLMQAAQQSGKNFVIVPNLDMTASAGKSDVATVASKLAELYRYSSAYRLSNGQFVLSSFAAERQSPAWWTQLKNTLAQQYGMPIAQISVLLNPSDANMKAYAPISYSLGDWGTRSPSAILNGPDYAAKAHALGTKWMSAVAVQDERPRSFVYAEAGNTETLRASWKRAQSDGADLVQLTTWNDYSEGTSFAPSAGHGTSFLDINAYYLTAFKTGTAPTVTGDAIYVTNRIQTVAATPITSQTLMQPTLGGTSEKPRDTVEVLTFLAKPATVDVMIGGTPASYDAPAGVFAKTFPLKFGAISATATRNGKQIAGVQAAHTATAKPLVQDLAYYASSSRQP